MITRQDLDDIAFLQRPVKCPSWTVMYAEPLPDGLDDRLDRIDGDAAVPEDTVALAVGVRQCQRFMTVLRLEEDVLVVTQIVGRPGCSGFPDKLVTPRQRRCGLG